ncbi:MAG TPA: response regulator [Candidatus Dormibacteraeota bacterium]|nr:response regulator [Candidatus Dormibacteraeota bacterium]
MNGRVLIVDDEPANAELLEAMLAQHPDLTVKSINDSRLAEHEFLEFEPDLMLLDLHMPEPDGLEILRRLRGARVSLGYLPVIVLSADGSRLARNSALGLGADDFLTKPFDHAEVLLRVRNLLHTRQLYMELASAKEALEQHEARSRQRSRGGSA